ncbi:CopG family transcriptional regulator [Aquiluna borgnonia]|jgi:predicted transcriptional regulator|uniref:CopG family transcriptional regulator n=1 Tax=Aquiluna borgnonia TaxID=2499157 RepID=A0A7D4QAS2_9MICO|nr:CopG family transcriptional regulator [Aquiluna borgnonia]QKJ24710.1 CopG family transcriptional regulator [Aquiluna borgnonia]
MAMTLRLSESQDELLTKIAQELNCSKHQAVIRALEAFDAKAHREKQIEYITKLVLERDKELLERLADA